MPTLIPTEELFERARKTLAGKSHSYVRDAVIFAKAVLLIEKMWQDGTLEKLEVEDG